MSQKSEMTLIERLRETANKGVSVWGDLQKEAADAIEALQAENERLKAGRMHFEKGARDAGKFLQKEISRITAERDALQAERERNLDSIRVNNEIISKKNAELAALAAKLVPLEADAERLNWIESKTHPSITIFKHFKGYKGYAFRFDDKSIGFEGSIRQAIDAAKGGQQ